MSHTKSPAPSARSPHPDSDPIEPPPSDDPRGGDFLIRGALNAVDSQGNATGWATLSGGTGLQVSFYVNGSKTRGGTLAGTITPSTREFSWPIPTQYRDGQQHSLWAYGVGTDDAGSIQTELLTGSPRYFTL